jgi:hypothetical protein
MKCGIPHELLSGYLDGELNDEQKKRIEEHIEKCTRCQEELEELRQMDGYVKAVEVEEPSREFVFGLNRRVMHAVTKRRKSLLFRFSPILAPVAVAALVLIILVNIDRRAGVVHVGHRILHAERLERKDIEIEIPSIGGARYYEEGKGIVSREEDVVAVPRLSTTAKAPEAAKKRVDADVGDEALSVIAGELVVLPEDKIVRAIVDSTGKVVKVATGNTIEPERDTVLENQLQGQQLTAPTVAGRRTQLYVDFTQKQEKDN